MADSENCKELRGHPYLVPVVFDKEQEETMEVSTVMDESTEQIYACIIGEDKQPYVEQALKELGMVVCYSPNGHKMPASIPDECYMIFVCREFEGPVFDSLLADKYRIYGPPCVLSCAQRGISLPKKARPVYSCTMQNAVVCFSGFHNKDDVQTICKLVHWMGGSVRSRISSDVTHVIAHSVSGTKYKDAVCLGLPIMSQEWVHAAWKCRDSIKVSATGEELMEHRQLPFLGCHVALCGFEEAEAVHVQEIAVQNGVVVCDLENPKLTHLLCASGVAVQNIPRVPSRVHIVKEQWFWESIQIEACADESLYYAKEQSLARRRKRRSRMSLNTSYGSFSSADFSLLEASLFSLSSPAAMKSSPKGGDRTVAMPTSEAKGAGAPCTHGSKEEIARHHIASELLQTEKNFVNILTTIVTVFKEPLECRDKRGNLLVNQEDLKCIFGNVADILAVHKSMKNEIERQMASWSSDSCIGNILLGQAGELLRVYPPFVNFFEMSKESLTKCDRQYPRFHAFLKAKECLPECGRQSLSELLITPVQRIPRIILLLQDLVKHTPPSHPDHTSLQQAVESLKTVMTHVNEDKRKMESHVQVFEVLNEVEDCPPTAFSSHRTYLHRMDVVELTGFNKNSKGHSLSLFIFSDSMEIAKRRSGHHGFGRPSTKPYRHLEFLPYAHVRFVVDFSEAEDLPGVFGVVVRWPEDPQEKLLLFRFTGEGKENVIEELSRLLADVNCSTMPDEFIKNASSDLVQQLGKSHDASGLRRAIVGARKRVRRAFSGKSTNRKVHTPLSVHTNAATPSTGAEATVLDDSLTDQSMNEGDDTLLSSCAVTPLSALRTSTLRTPQSKRPALSYAKSFNTFDVPEMKPDL